MTLALKVCTCVLKIFILPLKFMEAVGLFAIYKRLFPFLIYRISLTYNKKMFDKKKDLFRNLSDFAQKDCSLTILEIGCGSGANFEHYPSGCTVICTDPNLNFEYYLQKSIAANSHLKFTKFVVASGEDLGAVQSESVDVVVCTLVLCSVRCITRVLQETHRILRPGGALYFLEHVVSDPSTWAYFFQHMLQPLWHYFGDGCEVTRATWKYLEAARFSELKLSHIKAPLNFMIRPHIMGYAVK